MTEFPDSYFIYTMPVAVGEKECRFACLVTDIRQLACKLTTLAGMWALS